MLSRERGDIMEIDFRDYPDYLKIASELHTMWFRSLKDYNPDKTEALKQGSIALQLLEDLLRTGVTIESLQSIIDGELELQPSWQHIRLAPKDGTQVWLLLEDGRQVTGSWRMDEFTEDEPPQWFDDSHDDYSCGYASNPLTPVKFKVMTFNGSAEIPTPKEHRRTETRNKEMGKRKRVK